MTDLRGEAVVKAYRARMKKPRKPTNRKTRDYQYTLEQIRRLPTVGSVYFLWSKAGGPIKIGTAMNVEKRLAVIQMCSPVQLYIAAVVPGGKRREAELHRQFRHARLHGEWFDPTSDLVALIAAARGVHRGKA